MPENLYFFGVVFAEVKLLLLWHLLPLPFCLCTTSLPPPFRAGMGVSSVSRDLQLQLLPAQEGLPTHGNHDPHRQGSRVRLRAGILGEVRWEKKTKQCGMGREWPWHEVVQTFFASTNSPCFLGNLLANVKHSYCVWLPSLKTYLTHSRNSIQ